MRTTHPLSEPTSTQALSQESSITAIKHAVACFVGMPVEELHYNSTTRAVTVPRQIAMYLVKQMTDASLPKIGRRFVGEHHSTVIHAFAKIEERRHRDAGLDYPLSKFTTNTRASSSPWSIARPEPIAADEPTQSDHRLRRKAPFQVSKRQARSCVCSYDARA